jgi:cytidyltransferase-like protein
MKVVVVSGGMDPCHSGHIFMCNAARALGDMLIVGLNSDSWLIRKKGRAFMPWYERWSIISNIKAVDRVLAFDDSDGTACDLLNKVKQCYPDAQVIFANGGDRTQENIPEMQVPDVEFVFGVGGSDKANSSSWILEEWKSPQTKRTWGYYRVLHDVPNCKVKELVVDPGKLLSMQRHDFRSEYWFVTEGVATVLGTGGARTLVKHQALDIPVGDWHQLCNNTDHPLKIVEIQFGARCDEDDITRQ